MEEMIRGNWSTWSSDSDALSRI